MRINSCKLQSQIISLPNASPGGIEVEKFKSYPDGLSEMLAAEVAKQMNEALDKNHKQLYNLYWKNDDCNDEHG